MPYKSLSRRLLLALGGITLFALVARLAGFRPPRRKRFIEAPTRAMRNGVLVLADCVLFERDGSCWAVSRRCTHLGCVVNYHEIEDILECPCHQSRFATDGQVLRGPATRALPRYQARRQEEPPAYIIAVDD
ncbi:MAG: Rieske 2Fe-2S domain-containing protein [Desulfobulbaceae bacterium]|jgi:Rieske Fe-S protein|nr:Rieske 2Fe-2S domain-containing protein [Desulfobulbaceae bacterium]